MKLSQLITVTRFEADLFSIYFYIYWDIGRYNTHTHTHTNCSYTCLASPFRRNQDNLKYLVRLNLKRCLRQPSLAPSSVGRDEWKEVWKEKEKIMKMRKGDSTLTYPSQPIPTLRTLDVRLGYLYPHREVFSSVPDRVNASMNMWSTHTELCQH